ncbi:DNA circularization family protein [Burkholderia cepacia]|uniref:DNA circularization protein n=1 Tax=Burkholderia cenocepacia TaxID=95486 RepID=UPI0004F8ECE5|nr:DNA circularization N-terminal domain-containing protein [Burkholderia cenocepacia]AIO45139.1 DNA circularization family protein [Burkholderia cepacia]KGC02211.1 DNA circularization family protein [Burkholderia cepacia]MDN7662739.1 DNA circularization N-terminal domain-containing protein [Burkholderia cenocepacia]
MASTTTDILSVVGSIGGLASAADNLGSLLTGDWASNLKPASFGGVPFGVFEIRTSAGQNKAVHTYPFRDDVWAEDLGKKPRAFEVIGFLLENDLKTGAGPVIKQRDNLFAVCEGPGTATLVHPTLGTIYSVACLGIETVERIDLGPVFEIRLTLIKSGPRQFPTTQTSTADDSTEQSAGLKSKSLFDFAKDVAADIRNGAAVVQKAVSTVVGWYQLGVTAVNDVKRVIGAVSTLSGNFGRLFGGGNSGYSASNAKASTSATPADLLAKAAAGRAAVAITGAMMQAAAANTADAATFGASIDAFVAAVAASANDPADAVRLVSSLAQYSPDDVFVPGQIGASMSAVQNATAALLRRYALAQLAVTLTTYQPSSQQDAATVLSNALALYDVEILVAGDTGDDDTFVALRSLRRAIYADLTARGANLATLATFSFNAALPSLALAQRIYNDPAREPQLLQQIDPIHPAFCPIAFQALAK